MTNKDLANLQYPINSNIDIPIDELMKEIIYIVRNANIPQDVYEDLVACFTITLKRFFKGEKLSEMMTLLQKNEDEKIAAIVDKYGIGFDDVYKDGKYEGRIEGINKGINDTKIKNAKNLLAKGISEDIISECIGISITELENLKREL